MTTLQRAKWEAMAKMLGGASIQEKRMVTRGGGNIIPNKKGVLMSGYNLYMRSNMLAATSDMGYPRDEAPLAAGGIPAPSIKATLTGGQDDPAISCEINFLSLPPLEEIRVRTWFYLHSHCMSREAKIESVVPISVDSAGLSQPITVVFRGFKGSKMQWGKEWVKWSELDTGCVRIQSEIVMAYSRRHGAWRSVGSNVEEVVLPPQPNNPKAQEMLKFIREYKRSRDKRSYYRKNAMKIFSAKLGDKLMEGKTDGIIAEVMK